MEAQPKLMGYTIRTATEADVPDILAMIKELPICEGVDLEEVISTEASLLADGFGEKPLFKAAIATTIAVISPPTLATTTTTINIAMLLITAATTIATHIRHVQTNIACGVFCGFSQLCKPNRSVFKSCNSGNHP